jgi:molybdopterin-binding protein
MQRDFALSARNQLRVRVEALILDGVSAELRLAAAPGVELVAIISQASAQCLGLAVDQEVYAVIKANSAMIAPIAPPPLSGDPRARAAPESQAAK